jgi:hypothetical protein
MSEREFENWTRLVLVRHDEGRANVDGVIAGLSGCKGLMISSTEFVSEVSKMCPHATHRISSSFE